MEPFIDHNCIMFASEFIGCQKIYTYTVYKVFCLHETQSAQYHVDRANKMNILLTLKGHYSLFHAHKTAHETGCAP